MGKKGGTYAINDLKFKNDSIEDQVRTREIFENIRNKAKKDEYLSEHEKDFFCLSIAISLLNDGKWEDYQCCDNFKFKSLYLVYFTDLSGGGIYYKPVKGKYERVEIEEAQADLSFLKGISREWEQIINKENHSEELLKQSAKEARLDIKKLENEPEYKTDLFARGSNRFKGKKRNILLQSKYVYCIALEIFETLEKEDLIFSLNDIEIEFNEYSLIHILNRHYSAITKQYDTGKSFHKEDFIPRILNKQLKNIITAIDASKALQGKSLQKIPFRYKGVDYLVWVEEKVKQVKGQGNVNYRRLETFYPVIDHSELEKIHLNYNLVMIDGELSVYVIK